jgi:hypothetical protein
VWDKAKEIWERATPEEYHNLWINPNITIIKGIGAIRLIHNNTIIEGPTTAYKAVIS